MVGRARGGEGLLGGAGVEGAEVALDEGHPLVGDGAEGGGADDGVAEHEHVGVREDLAAHGVGRLVVAHSVEDADGALRRPQHDLAVVLVVATGSQLAPLKKHLFNQGCLFFFIYSSIIKMLIFFFFFYQ